jgi:hypothetical protein
MKIKSFFGFSSLSDTCLSFQLKYSSTPTSFLDTKYFVKEERKKEMEKKEDREGERW